MKKLLGVVLILVVVSGCEENYSSRLIQEIRQSFAEYNANFVFMANELWKTNRRLRKLEKRIQR